MTNEEIETAVESVKFVAGLAMHIPAETAIALCNQQSREETLMPILDPTQFRNNSKAIADNRTFLEAFRDFRLALERIAAGE